MAEENACHLPRKGTQGKALVRFGKQSAGADNERGADWGHDCCRFTLVTPLRAANGPDVLINRGWVPAEWAQDAQLRNQGEPSGKVCLLPPLYFVSEPFTLLQQAPPNPCSQQSAPPPLPRIPVGPNGCRGKVNCRAQSLKHSVGLSDPLKEWQVLIGAPLAISKLYT